MTDGSHDDSEPGPGGRGRRADPSRDPKERVETILSRALRLRESEQAAFIERECAGSPDLLAEVRSLLARVSDSFLETPAYLPEEGDRRPGDPGPTRELASTALGELAAWLPTAP